MNSVQATLKVLDSKRPFNFILNTISSIFPNLPPQSQLSVIATDYANYGLLYSCQIVGGIKTESASVLSRAKNLSNFTVTYLNNFFKNHNISLKIKNPILNCLKI